MITGIGGVSGVLDEFGNDVFACAFGSGREIDSEAGGEVCSATGSKTKLAAAA
jgi:hypothetical protein